MTNVRIGSRVWYKEGGNKDDKGTIVDIILDDNGPFIVKWDVQNPSIDQTILFPPNKIADSFGIEQHALVINKADENIDGFKASQLEVIEY